MRENARARDRPKNSAFSSARPPHACFCDVVMTSPPRSRCSRVTRDQVKLPSTAAHGAPHTGRPCSRCERVRACRRYDLTTHRHLCTTTAPPPRASAAAARGVPSGHPAAKPVLPILSECFPNISVLDSCIKNYTTTVHLCVCANSVSSQNFTPPPVSCSFPQRLRNFN